MSAGDGDATLRRFELDAVAACLVTAAAAFIVSRGRLDVALGVLGGGALIGISYWAIKGGVNLVVAAAAARPDGGPPRDGADGRPPVPGVQPAFNPPADEDLPASEPAPPALSTGRRVVLAVKFFTRYALLAVAAYVMLTCFRLHPVGVLAGATSPFLAALVLLGRLGRARARRRLP